MLHQFTIDDSELYSNYIIFMLFYFLACSFIVESKRDFKFKHNSVAENVKKRLFS